MKRFCKLACIALFLSAVLPVFVFAQNNPTVILQTNRGNIFVELYPSQAPITVDNFIAYVNEGFYDGLLFHRVIENFMIQAGAYYYTNNNFYEANANFPAIINESYNGLRNLRGTIAMARTDDPNSATSQFFINQVDNLSLDRQSSSVGYCVFGKVSHGINVVDTIATSPIKDYYPAYSNDPFNTIPSPFIGIYAARVVSTVLATKCTVTAVNKANSDKSSFSGTMDATVGDFNDANGTLEITIDSNDIVNPYALTFPINNKTFKKGKYSYSGPDGIVKKSFTYDMKTGKFTFAASNISLSGLDCPVILSIEIGNYVGVAEVNEAIVNGPKVPMPILLMMGINDTLRVDTCTVKQNNKKANSDQLTVKGAFAVKDTTVDMTKKEFVAALGAQTFTLPAGSFKRGKGAYSCANVKITGGTASATFNFNLCSFILTIKNANISPVSGNVDFGIRFADFNEIEQVALP